MEELTKLISSRRAHKSHLTKLRKKIDDTTQSTITETELALLKSYVEQLTQKKQTLQELNNKIVDLLQKPEDLEQETFEAEELNGLILEKICITDKFIENASKNLNQHATSPQDIDIASPISSQNGQQNQQPIPSTSTGTTGNDYPISSPALSENPSSSPPPVSTTHSFQSNRLPKLVLPSFNGNPLEWQTFWDAFRSAVHDNDTISDVQKFNYLKAQLCNGAERVIAGLPLTNANYSKSIELLQERFAQPHKIINAHMEALLNLPSPTGHLSSLRLFYDSIETHIRGLETLGKTTETYGDILVPIIQKKLPNEIKRNLARQNGNKEWHFDNLRKAILNEIEILEAGQNSSSDYEFNNRSTSTATAAFFMGSKPHSLLSPSNPGHHPTKQTCLFCKGDHSPNDCNVVTDKERRYALVRDARVCFNCLNRHPVSKCKSRNRCKVCHRKHHTSLCRDVETPPTVTPTESVTANKVTGTPITDKTTLSSVPSLHIGDTNTRTPILLKTAVAPIGSYNNHINAHIIFDEGSQRSFITSNVAVKLDLKPDTQETISLSTFGGKTSSVKCVDTATVYLTTIQGETIPIRAIIVPTIAAPLTVYTGTNVRDLPHLKGLTLAHPSVDDSPFTVDILIGADHYWDVVENKIVKGPGPTAAKSKIGYLLSGPLSKCNHPENLNASILHVMTEHQQENFDLERFWRMESVGVLPNSPRDTFDFLQHYQDTSIMLEDGRYSAKLPWQPEHPPLPSNAEITEQRTRSMVRRLTADPKETTTEDSSDTTVPDQQRGLHHLINPSDFSSLSKLLRVTAYVFRFVQHLQKKETQRGPITATEYDCAITEWIRNR